MVVTFFPSTSAVSPAYGVPLISSPGNVPSSYEIVNTILSPDVNAGVSKCFWSSLELSLIVTTSPPFVMLNVASCSTPSLNLKLNTLSVTLIASSSEPKWLKSNEPVLPSALDTRLFPGINENTIANVMANAKKRFNLFFIHFYLLL